MSDIQVCIFAYNLEAEIESSLRSITSVCGDYDAQFYVMINGCRDKTAEVVTQFSGEDPRVIPVVIALGDKSNAWNHFVYQCWDRNAIPVFLDGDLTFEASAIGNIVDYFRTYPQFNAVSSFPWGGGRSADRWREILLSEHQFTGNLYVLSPNFLKRMIEEEVKLPVGLIGDDSMLGFLTATDLCSPTDDPKSRIGVCQDAVFIYPRLNFFRYRDIRLYFRRRVRYSMRRVQQNIIVSSLKKRGLAAMPVKAEEAFRNSPNELKLRWRGVDTLFDFCAYQNIRKSLRKVGE